MRTLFGGVLTSVKPRTIFVLVSIVLFGFCSPSVVSADTLFSDGFESGDFSLWTSFDAKWVVNSISPQDGTKQAEVVGNTAGEDALTKVIPTTGFENIVLTYWYKINNSTQLEAADHLLVEWSTDGGLLWQATPLFDYTATTTGGAWVFATHAFPEAAENSALFAFRLLSRLSAASNDAVRFDTVVLSGEPRSVDVCPNIDGLQNVLPTNYHFEEGLCVADVPPLVDVCSNIDGLQETLPPNFHFEGDFCIEDVSPPVDVCSNIDGLQEVLPPNFHFEEDLCVADVPAPVDVCPNLDGVQATVPSEYHEQDGLCVLNEPPVKLQGSLTICKVLLNEKANVVTGDVGETFTIAGRVPNPVTSRGEPVGVLPTTVFTTPLPYNTILFGKKPNAVCVTHAGLALGGYYYDQESLADAPLWRKPRYDEFATKQIKNFSNASVWSGELYDNRARNDSWRNKNSDGFIMLTEKNPTKTLLIINQKIEKRCVSSGEQKGKWFDWYKKDKDDDKCGR